MSAALCDRDVTGGDFFFVSSERRQNFGLLSLWHLDEVQGPPKFRCHLIEFCGGNAEIPVGLFKSERRRAGLGGRKLVWPTRSVADPQRPHELEAGQPS